MTTYYEVSES